MKMNILVLLGVLTICVSVYSVPYQIPSLPCEWTQTLDYYDSYYGRTIRQVKSVNGGNMRILQEANHNKSSVTIYRDDLVPSVNGTGFIKTFTYNYQYSYQRNTTSISQSDYVWYQYPPMDPDGRPFMNGEYYFEDVIGAYYYGRECLKYLNRSSSSFYLYVDLKGFPIGGQLSSGKAFNCSFSFWAPLSDFALEKSAEFEDYRIYSPPKKTNCTLPSSSSVSSSGISSFFASSTSWTITVSTSLICLAMAFSLLRY